jgi:hypothetical protein
MNVITTRYGGGPVKSFSWSYTRLKNFEACPKRHYHIDIAKEFKDESGDALVWGNAVHKALAETLSKNKPLPVGMTHYDKWIQQIVTPGSILLVERDLAIDKDFAPTSWFDSDAKKKGTGLPWFRAKCDVIKIVGRAALVIDWKTGKIIEDSQQLALAAACVFAHYPEVQAVRSEFIWLKEDARTRADFRRNEMASMWRNIWPRIDALRVAHETTNYPAIPCYLCRNWCAVKTCPHNGV